MPPMRYVFTGGTGFIGRRVVSKLLETRPDDEVGVLVRRASLSRFERLASDWGERAKPVVGDLTEPELGLSRDDLTELAGVEHVVHCGAIYDITMSEPAQRAANVDGTRSVIALARGLNATLHHVSSIAVAGGFRGEYTEADFDVDQNLPTPYHRTKFEAEQLVRSEPGLRYRTYRPGAVVGDSRTGEMDKIDGPYYLFGVLAKLSRLPSFTPIMLPDSGRTNIVPVDYVVDAMVWLMHVPDRDGQTFHLTSPEPIGLQGIYRGVAKSAGLPPIRGSLPRAVAMPALKVRGRAKGGRNAGASPLSCSTSPTCPPHSIRMRRGRRCTAAESRFPASPRMRHSYGGTGRRTWTPIAPVATTRTGRWSASTSSSRARPAGSAARRRSPSRSGARRCSRWRATGRRSTI